MDPTRDPIEDGQIETKPSNIVQDALTGVYLIQALGRDKRPFDLSHLRVENTSGERCPFCPGHEHMTPPPGIWRWPKDGDPSSWQVRVVANKYAAMLIEGEPRFDETHLVDYKIISARGAHEVVIATPHHDATPATLGAAQWQLALTAIIARQHDLYFKFGGKLIKTWLSYGHPAGASQRHLHFQIMCLPINCERPIIDRAEEYRDVHQILLAEQIIARSQDDGLIVAKNDRFVALCPLASFQPYMIRIFPTVDAANLMQVEEHLFLLGQMLDEMMRRLEKVFGFVPSLAITFHEVPYTRSHAEDFFRCWLEIIPMVNRFAGFEWGDLFSCLINPVPPETAAAELRKVQI